MNWPNLLTLSRIVLTFIFLGLITQEGIGFKIAAAVVFGIAAITDLLDGYLAKKFNQITKFGILMDPIADKVLILTAFYVFSYLRLISVWMFVIIFWREFIITILRFVALKNGKVLPAEKAGKYKTFTQMLAISVILLFIIWKELAIHYSWPLHALPMWQTVMFICVTLAMILTVYSGIQYLWVNRRHYVS